MKKLAIVISSGFGSGFIKPGPGTWGTAMAFFITVIIWKSSLTLPISLPIVLSGFFYLLGLWSINNLGEDWDDDDQRIVVDEMIGFWITMIFVPLSWLNLSLAFILFRLFDIFKPLGIRRFDDIKTNWAVLVDDVVAGVYANIALRIILILLLWL